MRDSLATDGNGSPEDSSLFQVFERQQEDALLMLDHARKKGLDVSEHLINDLLSWDFRTEKTNDVKYAKFIDALSQLTKIISPVTPESIRFSSRLDKHGRSKLRSLVFLYAFVGYCLFGSLFLCQGYWFLLNGVVENINKTVLSLIPYGEMENATEDRLVDKLHHPVSADAVDDELNRSVYDQLGDDILQGKITPKAFQGFGVSGPSGKEKIYMSSTDRNYLKLSLESNLLALRRFVGVFSLAFIGRNVDTKNDIFYAYSVKLDDIRNIQAAHMVLDMLNRYILPIIYGFLGSSIYLVRRLTNEIRAVSFTESSLPELTTRFFLGGVSGLVVAWFVVPDVSGPANLLRYTSNPIANLSPLALSFVAGYAIEILFSVIDKIVAAFTEKSPKTS